MHHLHTDVSESAADAIIKQCVTCGKEFRLDHNDVEFYLKSGLPITDKCPHCRPHPANNFAGLSGR